MTPRDQVLCAISELEKSLAATGLKLPFVLIIADPESDHGGSISMFGALHHEANRIAMKANALKLFEDLEAGHYQGPEHG